MFGVCGYAPGQKVCLLLALSPCGSRTDSGLCLLISWGDGQTLVFLLQPSDETQWHHERGHNPMAVSLACVRCVQNAQAPA